MNMDENICEQNGDKTENEERKERMKQNKGIKNEG